MSRIYPDQLTNIGYFLYYDDDDYDFTYSMITSIMYFHTWIILASFI